MSDDVSYREAIEQVVGLLKSRWATAVLTALAAGPLRFTDLLAEINEAEARSGLADHRKPLTEKVLTATLRPMERAHLIQNHRQAATFAGGSWYELTVHGKTLLRSLRPVVAWAMDYHAAMAPSRDRQSRDEPRE